MNIQVSRTMMILLGFCLTPMEGMRKEEKIEVSAPFGCRKNPDPLSMLQQPSAPPLYHSPEPEEKIKASVTYLPALHHALANLHEDPEYQYLKDLIHNGDDDNFRTIITHALEQRATTLRALRDNHFNTYYQAYALSMIPTTLGSITGLLFVYASPKNYRPLVITLAALLNASLIGETMAAIAGYQFHRYYHLIHGDIQLERIHLLQTLLTAPVQS